MSNNFAKYEVLIKQYLRLILDISALKKHTAAVFARDTADVEINYILLQRSVLEEQYMICSANVLSVNMWCKQ